MDRERRLYIAALRGAPGSPKIHLTLKRAAQDNVSKQIAEAKAKTKTVRKRAETRLPKQGAVAMDWERPRRQLRNSLPS